MLIWKCYIMHLSSFAYPANSSLNPVLFTSANGQVEFCVCEPQTE